jgi:GMP synthase (glutamine-hydrolysing)
MSRLSVLVVVHNEDGGLGVFGPELDRVGARRVVWDPPSGETEPVDAAFVDAAIVLGGTMQVDQDAEHPWLDAERTLLRELIARRTPVLGVCLGAQLLAQAVGGAAVPAREAEVGWDIPERLAGWDTDPLFGPLPATPVFACHAYSCLLPDGMPALARTDVCTQAFRAAPAAWGVQWHPEVEPEQLRRWVGSGIVASMAPGVDVPALLDESDRRLDASNEQGRMLCRRFLALARRDDAEVR